MWSDPSPCEASSRLPVGPFLTPAKLLADDVSPAIAFYDQRARNELTSMADYVVNILAKEHPELGRAGPVCPFMPGAVQRNLVHITSSDLEDEAALTETMDNLRGVFASASSGSSGNNAIFWAFIVLLPKLVGDTGAQIIKRVQESLKPAFVRQGFMIGEFYPGCPATGLHNQNFRPFNSPVPSLAIRHITIFDAPFVVDHDDLIEVFADRFGAEGMKRVDALLQARASAVDGS
jgi:hypothetical protein